MYVFDIALVQLTSKCFLCLTSKCLFYFKVFFGLFFAVQECGMRWKLFGFFNDRCLCFFITHFVAITVSEVMLLLFDLGCISTISDAELLAVVVIVNILFFEDVG